MTRQRTNLTSEVWGSNQWESNCRGEEVSLDQALSAPEACPGGGTNDPGMWKGAFASLTSL